MEHYKRKEVDEEEEDKKKESDTEEWDHDKYSKKEKEEGEKDLEANDKKQEKERKKAEKKAKKKLEYSTPQGKVDRIKKRLAKCDKFDKKEGLSEAEKAYNELKRDHLNKLLKKALNKLATHKDSPSAKDEEMPQAPVAKRARTDEHI